jgi:integrase
VEDAMREIGATTPVAANHFVTLVASLISFAGTGISGHKGLNWLAPGLPNPAARIERYREDPREQNLSPDEMRRLLAAIDRYQDATAGKQIRLIMLTLARKSEVLGARWNEFNLESSPAIWTKPAARMKAGRTVRVPVLGGALAILRRMKAEANAQPDAHLFRGRDHGHSTLRRKWVRITREANLPELHIHDCRHLGATVLASGGVPLFVIAKLLGHASTSRVTERYSHLSDRAASDAVAALEAHYRSATAIEATNGLTMPADGAIAR